MIIIHNKDGNRMVMTYKEAVAKGYIKQPTVTWSAGIIKQKAQEK
jgi:hypothetical protein